VIEYVDGTRLDHQDQPRYASSETSRTSGT
jgi:hypothetical protein